MTWKSSSPPSSVAVGRRRSLRADPLRKSVGGSDRPCRGVCDASLPLSIGRCESSSAEAQTLPRTSRGQFGPASRFVAPRSSFAPCEKRRRRFFQLGWSCGGVRRRHRGRYENPCRSASPRPRAGMTQQYASPHRFVPVREVAAEPPRQSTTPNANADPRSKFLLKTANDVRVGTRRKRRKTGSVLKRADERGDVTSFGGILGHDISSSSSSSQFEFPSLPSAFAAARRPTLARIKCACMS